MAVFLFGVVIFLETAGGQRSDHSLALIKEVLTHKHLALNRDTG